MKSRKRRSIERRVERGVRRNRGGGRKRGGRELERKRKLNLQVTYHSSTAVEEVVS